MSDEDKEEQFGNTTLGTALGAAAVVLAAGLGLAAIIWALGMCLP